MSFVLELYADVRSWEEAERAAVATAENGLLSVVAGRRSRWGRALPPTVQFAGREADAVLGDDAAWSQDALELSITGREALAKTMLMLSTLLEPGWGVRAYWIGDVLREERSLSSDELAKLIRAPRLDRSTLYRVI